MLCEEVLGFRTAQPKKLANLSLSETFLAITLHGECLERAPGEISIATLGERVGNFVRQLQRDHHVLRVPPPGGRRALYPWSKLRAHVSPRG